MGTSHNLISQCQKVDVFFVPERYVQLMVPKRA